MFIATVFLDDEQSYDHTAIEWPRVDGREGTLTIYTPHSNETYNWDKVTRLSVVTLPDDEDTQTTN